MVDLLLGVGQEAGPEQRLLAHQHRRHDGLEAPAAEQLERPAHERELEQHERPLQVGEARAGYSRAGLEVDEAAEQLEVILARGARVSDLAQDSVRVGRALLRRVRKHGEHRVERLLHATQLGVDLLLASGGLAHGRDRRGGVPALAPELTDALAGGIPVRAQGLQLG
jgi:hypothetical protein